MKRYLLSLTLLFAALVTANAATITVNSTADPGDGVCDANECTLREAIAAAAQLEGEGDDQVGDTIEFAVTGTIQLTSTLVIEKNLTIRGPVDASGIVLDGQNSIQVMRIGFPFFVVNLENLTITKGRSIRGGGLRNTSLSRVTITGCTITGNTADGDTDVGLAGGILTGGRSTLDIVRSTITGNSVIGRHGAGGGIHVEFFDAQNSFGSAYLTITDSLISNNSIETTGDAIGGGVDFSARSGEVRVLRTTIENNRVQGTSLVEGGGIIVHRNDYFEIRDCTISGNTVFNVATDPGFGAYAGGVLGDKLQIINSTIANNTATSTNGFGQGGGLLTSEAAGTVVRNSTISGNLVASGSGGTGGQGGGVHVFQDGRFETGMTVSNSIIAKNTANTGRDVFGPFVSEGFNLIGTGDGSTGFTAGAGGDQVGSDVAPIDPQLAPLANYNGPRMTMALLANSPAINAGDPAFSASAFTPALTTDERGAPRVRGGRLDIGAYEAAAAPAIVAPANNARTSATPTISGTAGAGETVTITITGGSSPVVFTTTADSSGNFSASSPTLADGNYTVSATARFANEAESPASNSRAFAVDATPPVISGVPPNMTVEATSPNGAQVTYTNPTANDNVDGAVPVNCAPASGSTFSMGSTLVTCSAQDAAGNTAMANFTVTVQDTTAPAINNVPANITAEATGPNGAAVNYANPTATDAVSGNVPVNCSPASGSTFALGSTTVTCTASDNAGNSASATFTITVRDTTAPAISVPADIVVYNEEGKDGATVTFSISANDAVSGAITPSVNPPSGSVFPIGTTTVTVTAQDAAGNTASKTFEVTVRKTELANIATRVPVGTGEKVGIGGFIIRGTDPLRVIVRARGPSMRSNGQPVPGAMENPALDVYDSSGNPTPFASNDNWQDSPDRDEIAASGLAPEDGREAAIIAVLPAGAYTGIVSGAGGSTGNALIEVFALPGESNSSLVNISTRGPVLTADDLLIGGVIVRGGTPQRLVFRAIGPDLANRGVAEALSNPRLELRDTNGDLIVSNDNWQQSADAAEIQAKGLAPNDPREAAILRSLGNGDYTAVVRGENGATGIGMVEVYRLD